MKKLLENLQYIYIYIKKGGLYLLNLSNPSLTERGVMAQ